MSSTELFRKHFGEQSAAVDLKHPNMEAFFNELNEECLRENEKKIMKSTITITPAENIKDRRVIDESKIEQRTYDSDTDVFTFYNVKYKETRRSNLMNVSIFNDLIVDGDVQYKILAMLSM